jgi:hypothetical protein
MIGDDIKYIGWEGNVDYAECSIGISCTGKVKIKKLEMWFCRR